MEEARSGKRSAIFDLLHQPFSILHLEPTATADQISEAFEDACADRLAPESELVAAREAIVNPRLRLAAELAWLLDTPPGEAKAVFAALRNEASLFDLRRVADRLPALSKANLLAHIAAHEPADADLLVSLVDAHASINAATLQPAIEGIRKASGNVNSSLDALRVALHELADRHSKAAFGGFAAIRNAAGAMQACTTRVLERPSQDRIEALDGVVRAYRQSIGPELMRCEERVKAAIATLRAQPQAIGPVTAIGEAVREWAEMGRPLIALEAYKGRDDERARELFYSVRGLAIDIANEHKSFDLALSLSQIALGAFRDMPRAAGQLHEDIPFIVEQLADAALQPLRKLIASLDNDFIRLALAKDLIAFDFGERSVNETKEIFELFLVAITKTRGSKFNDIPSLLSG